MATATDEQVETTDTLEAPVTEQEEKAIEAITAKRKEVEAREMSDQPTAIDDEEDDDDATEESVADAEEYEPDEELLDRAEDLGLRRSQARKIGEGLEDLLDQLERRQGKLANQQTVTKDETKAKAPEPYKVQLKEEDGYEPEIVAEVQRLADHFQSEVAALRKEISSELRQAQEGSFEDRVHQLIAERSDTWADVLGGGTSATRTHMRKRQDVMRQMRVIADGLKANNLKARPEGELLDQALHSLYPEHLAAQAAKRKSDKAKKRAGQHLNRPAGSRQVSTPAAGEEAVVDFISKWRKKRDMA